MTVSGEVTVLEEHEYPHVEPDARLRAEREYQQEFWSDPCWCNPDDDYTNPIY